MKQEKQNYKVEEWLQREKALVIATKSEVERLDLCNILCLCVKALHSKKKFLHSPISRNPTPNQSGCVTHKVFCVRISVSIL